MIAYLDDYTEIKIETKTPIVNPIVLEGTKYPITKITEGCYAIKIPENLIKIPNEYYIQVEDKNIPVCYRGVVKTDTFNEKYDASDITLGASVEGETTWFRLYAPTATFVHVVINETTYTMNRLNNGVYEVKINQNLHGHSYYYETRVNHQINTFTDPYAKASLPNRQASIVVDFNLLNLYKEPLTKITDPKILELSVRDFTMDPHVNFNHKGKLLGLLESQGAYGMSFIRDLAINYIQLMPIIDFETVDELDINKKYNWGYDVMQFMSLEGSYSSDIHNPTQVLLDLNKVVNTYHQEEIGVIMDVVFNHVYEVEDSPLHLSVPYYYFRYDDDYNLTNGSFCGNELATEMPMTRKLIVDSCVYFVKRFGIDGFRFDLMGLMDIKTINEIYNQTVKINPDILIYGEGWNMDDVYPMEYRACMQNYKEMPHVKHFNDYFRDTVGGSTDTTTKGITMIKSKPEELVDLLNGKTEVFDDSEYTINYVECHDNYTVKDKMDILKGSLNNISIMNAIVALSKGTPFIHIGQSFGRDKQGEENSYKSSDVINRIDWKKLSENTSLNDELKLWFSLRSDVLNSEWKVNKEGVEVSVPSGKIIFSYDKEIISKVEFKYSK